MTRRCDGCVHFHPDVTTGNTTYRGGAGECRAKTPTAFPVKQSGGWDEAYRMWPIVRIDDWCSEFAPAREPEKAR